MSPKAAATVLYSGDPQKADAYRQALTQAAGDLGVDIPLAMSPDDVATEDVAYLIFDGSGPVKDFTPFPNLRAVLNLWAGVEAVMRCNPAPDLPVARMIETGLTEGMRDYVIGHVLRHHLDIDRYLSGNPIAEWEATFPPLARHRTVGVLGIGTLGADCATHLARHGFRTLGWSRSQKSVDGVTCLSGADGLERVIRESEILALLLPHTDDTYRLMNAERIGWMPRGACLVNAGRGPLIDHDALLVALNAGHLRHATMDVFDTEPLPADHPYWAHPRVTVTPHIASVTRIETAAEAIIANIARDRRGEAMIGLVQRDLGY